MVCILKSTQFNITPPAEQKDCGNSKCQPTNNEILFIDYGIQLKEAEKVVSKAIHVSNNIIETINDNLHNANLIQECPPSSLLDIKYLERQW